LTPRSTLFPYTTLFRSHICNCNCEHNRRPISRRDFITTASAAAVALTLPDLHAQAPSEPPPAGTAPPAGAMTHPLIDIHAHQSRSEEHTSELQSRFDLV